MEKKPKKSSQTNTKYKELTFYIFNVKKLIRKLIQHLRHYKYIDPNFWFSKLTKLITSCSNIRWDDFVFLKHFHFTVATWPEAWEACNSRITKWTHYQQVSSSFCCYCCVKSCTVGLVKWWSPEFFLEPFSRPSGSGDQLDFLKLFWLGIY